MKRIIAILIMAVTAAGAYAECFEKVPSAWKWISDREVVFTYNGKYTDSTAFSYDVLTRRVRHGVTAPGKYRSFPLDIKDAVNMTYSPDSTMIAFTRDNDLYVADIATGAEHRITFDGSSLILNGYASWVYYEEIFGRPTRYRAF